MATNLEIPQFCTTQYDANWRHLVQQSEGRIHSRVTQETVKGKRKLIPFMGKRTVRQITTRSGKTIPYNSPLAKRVISLKPYDDVVLEDEWDDALLGEVTSPTHAYVRAMAMAFQRTFDKIVCDAAVGTAYVGEDGQEAVDVPNSQKVPVNYVFGGTGANSGLTLAKMIRAKSILGQNEAWGQNQPGPLSSSAVAAVCQQQIDDLLTNVDQVSNTRYADVKALVNGEVNFFMGFEFIRMANETLPLDTATDIRTCLFMLTDGIAFSSNGYATKISVRDDLNESLQIRTKCRAGATRTEEEKVVLVYCDQSP